MTKIDLHRLVEELPETFINEAAVVLAHVTIDPMLRVHYLADWDDEPLTEEDRAALQEGIAQADRGETKPLTPSVMERNSNG
ncbi:MAG: hypothetical protein ACREP9_07225 [Candidatus Dormibacteraceae bacterium]